MSTSSSQIKARKGYPKQERRRSPKKLSSGELAIPHFQTIERWIACTIVTDMNIPTSARPDIVLDGFQFEILLRGLDDLNKAAYAEYRRAPRASVTHAELSGLIKKLDSFRKSLDPLDAPPPDNPLPALFQATTLHMQLSLHSETRRTTPFTAFSDILGRLDDAIVDLRDVMIYFERMKADFQALNRSERWDFFFNASTPLHAKVNQAIYPYIRKGNGLGLDTYIARHLARIYEQTFGEPISYSRINPDLTKLPAKDKTESLSRQFHDGIALRFVCATIRWLKLYTFMSPNLISDPHAPFPWDTKKEVLSPWEAVKNRIATIWENDKTRDDRHELFS